MTDHNVSEQELITENSQIQIMDEEQEKDELDAMELGTASLLDDDSISPSEAINLKEKILKARKSFSQLTPAQKKSIIKKRVISGGKMFDSTLKGNTALVMNLTLKHGILLNRFTQFVPHYDRALVNMNMFGDIAFGKKNNEKRYQALVESVTQFYTEAIKARKVAEDLVAKAKDKFDNEGELYFDLTVPNPAIQTEIHIHNKHSQKHVDAYLEFDRLITATKWLIWYGVRTEKEINEELKPLYKLSLSVGTRGYSTFIDLLNKRNSNANQDQSASNNPNIAANTKEIENVA